MRVKRERVKRSNSPVVSGFEQMERGALLRQFRKCHIAQSNALRSGKPGHPQLAREERRDTAQINVVAGTATLPPSLSPGRLEV